MYQPILFTHQGLRWQPEGVLRAPTLLKDQGGLNANSLLLEIGAGWCWATQQRLIDGPGCD